MAILERNSESKPSPAAHLLEVATRTMEFHPGRANDLLLSQDAVRQYVQEELKFERIPLDHSGFSVGMQLHVLQPAKSLIADWKQGVAPFVTALQPFLKKIEAVEKIDIAIEEAKLRKQEEADQIIARSENDSAYLTKKARQEDTKKSYEIVFDEEARREPVMAAYTIWYWLGLFLIGCAEWLINYDTFFLFMGVPAIAAGATLVLGVLLAFSAHGHGTILKQWSHRFGAYQKPQEKWGNWRFLGLSTFSVLVVVGAAGGSRYGAALHALRNQPEVNILGAAAMIDVNPLRDVLLSLLANIAAWAVGVYLAYLCHDKNPELMSRTRSFQHADRAYRRAKKKYDDELQANQANLAREIEKQRKRASSQASDVVQERDLLKQVRSHEKGIFSAIEAVTLRNLESYRAAILSNADVQNGKVKLVIGDKQLTPHEYQNQTLSLGEPFAQSTL